MQGLDPLGAGDGGGKAPRHVLGHMRAADGEAVDVHQATARIDRHGGRAAAHVDADGPQVHLVLLQRRQGGGEGRGDHALETQVGPLDAVPQGLQHALVHGDHQQFETQSAAEHGARIPHPPLAVHGPGDGAQVDGAAALQTERGQGLGDGAPQVGVGDRAGAQGNLGRNAMAGQLAAGGGDGNARDIDPGHGLGALDRLGDGLGGLVHVDDGAAAHAARLHVANAASAERALLAADAVGLHDEAGDLGGAQVDGRDDRRAAQGRLQPVAVVTPLAVRGGLPPLLQSHLHLDPVRHQGRGAC